VYGISQGLFIPSPPRIKSYPNKIYNKVDGALTNSKVSKRNVIRSIKVLILKPSDEKIVVSSFTREKM
jgi:hypothetical protein